VFVVSENILYDAIVVGGGPAGSTAAALLSKKGRRVLILEKETWPRDKTCGDAISGKSLKILHELGLVEKIERSDHCRTSGMVFSAPNGKAVSIPFRSDGNGISRGYVCRRQVYDNLSGRTPKNRQIFMKGPQLSA